MLINPYVYNESKSKLHWCETERYKTQDSPYVEYQIQCVCLWWVLLNICAWDFIYIDSIRTYELSVAAATAWCLGVAWRLLNHIRTPSY